MFFCQGINYFFILSFIFSQYFDYILKVLVPETMKILLKTIEDHKKVNCEFQVFKFISSLCLKLARKNKGPRRN